jgi:glycosyltransferase involved in cell wall biosynthesis
MKIAQIVLPATSEYARKSQRIDRAALSQAGHEVAVYDDPREARAGDVAHVYGTARRIKLRIPHVMDAELTLPEAVEEAYWTVPPDGLKPVLHHIGAFDRPSVRNLVQQTYGRIHRTRDDIEWRLFERTPAPDEIAQVAVWVDPALHDDDYDGFVAEALVCGNVVVAARTIINVQRLEKGRTGFLAPPNDPNELTHAILAALFKPELGQAKASAALQTISKFRPRQRLRALVPIYESLLR